LTPAQLAARRAAARAKAEEARRWPKRILDAAFAIEKLRRAAGDAREVSQKDIARVLRVSLRTVQRYWTESGVPILFAETRREKARRWAREARAAADAALAADLIPAEPTAEPPSEPAIRRAKAERHRWR
jgi:AraC-like DNA-binding protein